MSARREMAGHSSRLVSSLLKPNVRPLPRLWSDRGLRNAACAALVAGWLVLPAVAVEPSNDDLLPAEVAFRTAARLVGPKRIEIRYDTAPGYYLYRDRLSFAVDPPTAGLGKPALPPGKIKKDEFFGRQVIYRNKTIVTLPVHWDGKTPLSLTAELQGCAAGFGAKVDWEPSPG